MLSDPAHAPAGTADLSALRISREARPKRRRPRGWRGLLVAILGFGLGALGYQALKSKAPVVRVGKVTATGGSGDNAVLSATGYVVPRRWAGVAPKVTGRIRVLNKDLGDKVVKDEVLAELDSADVRALLDEAKAASWVADLTAERDQKLAQSDAGAKADSDISLARSKEAAARVKNLEEQVENTRVRAPFDGIIIVKNGEVGETVSLFGGQTTRKSGPIFVVADFREFEVEADINESNIGKAQEGQPAEVALIGVPDRRYRGKLRQLVPTADRQKATIQAKISILDPDERVLPEMSAQVTFLKSAQATTEPPRIVVPAEGIVERAGRQAAFVLEGDRVHLVTVEADAAEKGLARVRSGLSSGQLVVLAPPPDLADGDRVRVEGEK